MSGTVNIARDLWKDTTFRDAKMSQREAWIWLIAEASWKERARRIGSYEVVLRRGQAAASTRFLAEAWKWSEPGVRRYLGMLEKRRMITRTTDAGVTVITIQNYDKYQSQPRANGSEATQEPTQDRRTSDANDNKGEIREKIGGGGRACACEAEPDPTFRERILAAIGVDPSGLTGRGGTRIGTQADMIEANRWVSDLGLTEAEILAEVRAVASAKQGGPPSRFAYFTQAMQRLAAAKAAPPPTIPAAAQRKPSAEDQVSAAFARLEAQGRI